MVDKTYAVIMAGGEGTRLWPVSRKSRPKHMLPLLGEKTLFESTIERLRELFPAERILVVTVQNQAEALKAQAPEIPVENFLLEPGPRGTAAVVGLAASVLQKRDPQATMVILPSDHYIRNRDLFFHILRVAIEVANDDYLVTLGITPTHPSTAYGYIQRGEPLPGKYPYPAYHVLRFKEKPAEPQARAMIAQGDHSWNSGMFIWKVDRILSEISTQMPDLMTVLGQISDAWGTPDFESTLNSLWVGLKPETIDYGVMEKAGNVSVIPAGGLEWSDVGSWDSLFEVMLPDEDGNVVFNGPYESLDTHNTLIYGQESERMIVTIGVDDLIIVDAGDILLVCRKEHAQKVKDIVAILKSKKEEKYY